MSRYDFFIWMEIRHPLDEHSLSQKPQKMTFSAVGLILKLLLEVNIHISAERHFNYKSWFPLPLATEDYIFIGLFYYQIMLLFINAPL
jgi:hypothetical protein